jgi:glycerol kinase
VPAFTGLGAPHWDPHARGTLCGITRGTTRGHVARATLEAIALQTADIVKAMQADTGLAIPELRVDGGASANALLMQLQADVLGVPVVQAAHAESTALGAALLAGQGVGLWLDGEALDQRWRAGRRFEPAMPARQVAVLEAQWRRALQRAGGWAGED